MFIGLVHPVHGWSIAFNNRSPVKQIPTPAFAELISWDNFLDIKYKSTYIHEWIYLIKSEENGEFPSRKGKRPRLRQYSKQFRIPVPILRSFFFFLLFSYFLLSFLQLFLLSFFSSVFLSFITFFHFSFIHSFLPTFMHSYFLRSFLLLFFLRSFLPSFIYSFLSFFLSFSLSFPFLARSVGASLKRSKTPPTSVLDMKQNNLIARV